LRTRLIINPAYQELEDFIRNLPETFDFTGETIYDGRNTIKIIDTKSIRVNVKSFQKPNIINKFVYGNFRKSKAQRSFEYANILIKNKIDTPTPIGYMELRSGLSFGQSYYISVQEDFDGIMREFQRGTLAGRENLLQQFAQFTADMHEKQILHMDYSPGNILYKKSGESFRFYLVDLNRMFFGQISKEKGCQNFCRLWGNEEMISYIASEYAKARDFDIKTCIELTLSYHREFWTKFSSRHPGKKPYIED